MNIFRKLFGKRETSTSSGIPREQAAPVLEAVGEDERLEDLYHAFYETFYVRPGVKLMDALRAEGLSPMIDWLRRDTLEPEPKAFIRMAVAMTRRNMPMWEQERINSYREGGPPSQNSVDALATLAKVLGVQIRIFYEETPGGQMMVWEFMP